MKKYLEKRSDGVYTRLLMRAQNLSWKDHHTVADIHGNITPITRRLTSRRHRFGGHCFRDKSQIIYDLILWKLSTHKKENVPSTTLMQSFVTLASAIKNYLQLCQIEPIGEILQIQTFSFEYIHVLRTLLL